MQEHYQVPTTSIHLSTYPYRVRGKSWSKIKFRIISHASPPTLPPCIQRSPKNHDWKKKKNQTLHHLKH